ncbi:hypothetical protein C9374_014048 [Naegleria lovaniensis]|uniref:Uncharacterized protein n=1 Tax=Naegleria lovaniensis TaxID=51637 RepID=A0AA88H1X3_NAELO|nr:uncharacterized protein C9374_014048 [Naegleria lovaniensis]KAG2389488.1 hypothetical protein C9374_014048 [Naegleria lovaniensis]
MYNTETHSLTPFYQIPPDGVIHVIVYEPKCDLLFIGGKFTSIDGVKTGPIAVKMGAASTSSSSSSNSNGKNQTNSLWTSLNVFDRDIYMGEWSENATILDIKVFYNNVFKQCQPSILMAGQFTKAAGIENVNNIVMIDTNSLKWDLFANSAGVRGVRGTSIHTVLIHDDNYIYVGGNFPDYFKRYQNGKWETLLQGQLNGPVTSIALQNNHIYEDVFVVGGTFTAPKQYLFLYKPSKSIHYIRHFKKRVVLFTPTQVFDDSLRGIKKMDIYQDQLYMAGQFVYQSDWGEIPPFKFCSKGSYVMAKQDFEMLPNHTEFYYKDYMTLLLHKEDRDDMVLDDAINLFVDPSEPDIPVIHSTIFMASSAAICRLSLALIVSVSIMWLL